MRPVGTHGPVWFGNTRRVSTHTGGFSPPVAMLARLLQSFLRHDSLEVEVTSQSDAKGPNRGMRILLVDDNEELLYSLCRTFKNAGFTVASAPDAETALDQLPGHAPDVVLTDLRLPGRSGLDLLRAVRELMPNVPVLIITAYGDEDTCAAASSMGAFAMLTKPVFRQELLSTVHRALERHAAEPAAPAPPPGGPPVDSGPRKRDGEA